MFVKKTKSNVYLFLICTVLVSCSKKESELEPLTKTKFDVSEKEALIFALKYLIMKNILFFIPLMLLVACSSDKNDENPIKGFVYDASVGFYVENEKGEDLLDSQTEGFLSIEDMKLYYLIDGKKMIANRFVSPLGGYKDKGIGLSDSSPVQLTCYTPIQVDAAVEVSEADGVITARSVSFIEFNKGEYTDTIITEWVTNHTTYARNKKIWYNGVEYDVNEVFTVVK